MDFESTFPMRVYLNLGRREQRRHHTEAHFIERGLTVDRQPAVAAKWLRDPRGYPTTARRAMALGKRLAIRRAMCAGAEALFFFEDDVVLHPEWRERVEGITLPRDWGIFLLGAYHEVKPRPFSPGLVKCVRAVDHHAIGIRADRFQELRVLLRGSALVPCGGSGCFSDQRVAGAQHRIPTYAAWPNLAWQSGRDSHTNYDPDGRQFRAVWAPALDSEMASLYGHFPSSVRPEAQG